MRKLAIGRLFNTGLALLSITGAIFFYSASVYMDGEFQKWTTARPMETKIDFSQPGTITVPFHQTCSVSHGEGVFLDHDINDESNDMSVGVLAGLSAVIMITDQDGNEILRRALVDYRTHPSGSRIVRLVPGEIMLADIPTFKRGDYNATIIVQEGLPALADLPLTIYAKYQLCGCEQMTGALFGVFSFCAGFIGIIAVLIVTPGLWRSGIWRDVKTEVVQEVKTESES
ncbi:MAG: hypothetical protein QM501_11680 [Gimesia sp.]